MDAGGGGGSGEGGGGCFLLPGNIPLQRCGCVCNASVRANMRASGVHFFVYSGGWGGGSHFHAICETLKGIVGAKGWQTHQGTPAVSCH